MRILKEFTKMTELTNNQPEGIDQWSDSKEQVQPRSSVIASDEEINELEKISIKRALESLCFISQSHLI